MATQTKILGTFDDGNVEFNIDYDDVTLYITAFRCINGSTQNAYGRATRLSNGKTYERVFPPGTITVVIPTNAANRLALFLNPNGKLDGVEYHLSFPYG
jgi:hypothetical protein